MAEAPDTRATWLDLYDFRRRVARMYAERDAELRAGADPATVWEQWRRAKDELYAHHLQTPLSPEDRATFAGLPYYPYDPAFAVHAMLEPRDDQAREVPASGPIAARFPLAARLSFSLCGQDLSLAVYWIDVYGGGLFCPVRDATSGHESYGGGRYLFDTVKGSDLARLDDAPRAADSYVGGLVLLDFNYLYNPSCAYDGRWACPLAPVENVLPVAVEAGERVFAAHEG